MVEWKDFQGKDPIWCPGCGDFGVLRSLQKALAAAGKDPSKTVIVTGIGCSGNSTAYLSCMGVHGIHGRALPLATGIALANPDLTVIAMGGDGDGYGIGAGHFLHTARRNPNLTYIVMDNQVYGLTKGQASPTTPEGRTSKASPLGPLADALRPLPLSLQAGSSFVAQESSANQGDLEAHIVAAMEHAGFAHINVLSPCVTFNHEMTYPKLKEHGKRIEHAPSDWKAAMDAAQSPDALPLGILYQETSEPFHSQQPKGDRVGPNLKPGEAYQEHQQLFEQWVEALRA